MQSSYNIIKHTNIVTQGNKEIVTNIDNIRKKEPAIDNQQEINELEQAFASEIIQKAEEEAAGILQNAQVMAEAIRKEAYESAYSEGFEQGSNQGYTDAYEKTLIVAKQEAEQIVAQANTFLLGAKEEYEAYMEAKSEEIHELVIHMAEKVLRRELVCDNGINEMVREVLSESRSAKSFLIRTNQLYAEEIKCNINAWRENLGLKGEIFIVIDESIGPNRAIVEKNNGSVEVGLEIGIEGIRQAIL